MLSRPSGIKLATFCLVAQCLNQLCLHVHHPGHTLPENASVNELLYQKAQYTFFFNDQILQYSSS
jgi:hypothetical protein